MRMVVMMYVSYPLSLRNVEDLLAERGVDICHETVRLWRNRLARMFAAEIRKKRVNQELTKFRKNDESFYSLMIALPSTPGEIFIIKKTVEFEELNLYGYSSLFYARQWRLMHCMVKHWEDHLIGRMLVRQVY
jgi:hypothetical protein